MTVEMASLNLYSSATQQNAGKLVQARGEPKAPGPELAQVGQAAPVTATDRALPEGVVVDQPLRQYTQAQLEMRPVDRADAALMAVVAPEDFGRLTDALASDGDWRSLLSAFTQRLGSNPQWLEDQYRLPAAEVLRQTSNFLDLSGLKR